MDLCKNEKEGNFEIGPILRDPDNILEFESETGAPSMKLEKKESTKEFYFDKGDVVSKREEEESSSELSEENCDKREESKSSMSG